MHGTHPSSFSSGAVAYSCRQSELSNEPMTYALLRETCSWPGCARSPERSARSRDESASFLHTHPDTQLQTNKLTSAPFWPV